MNLQCLSLIDQLVRAVGQNYRDFRDLFSCTFLTKDFPEKRYFVSNCPVLSITDSMLSRQSPVGNFSYRIQPGNFRACPTPVPVEAWRLAGIAWRRDRTAVVAPRLAGFGGGRALKNARTCAFGWQIVCRMGWIMTE